MATTLAQLVTRLSEDYLRDTNHRIRPEDVKKRAINKAYKNVMKEFNFAIDTLEATATGSTVSWTATITQPTGFVSLESILIEDDRLERRDRTYVAEHPTSNTRPNAYYITDDDIVLYPTPDGAYSYTILYNKLATALSSDSDTVWMDDVSLDDAILLYAWYKLLLPLDANKAMALRNDYNDVVNWLRYQFQYDTEDLQAFMPIHKTMKWPKEL